MLVFKIDTKYYKHEPEEFKPYVIEGYENLDLRRGVGQYWILGQPTIQTNI